MSEIKLTPEQAEATVNSGGQLLVSAAAGSGKTKVLVERLLKRVDAGLDVDDFLIITYTNAAAAELRGKIMDAIYERLADEPENKRLRREAALCGKAQIETIHSFCSGVIRENAHILGIAPDFRIADENESLLLKQDVLSNMLDELYDSGGAEFFALADTMGAGRDDSALGSVILDTHTKLLSHPDPEKWVDKQIKMLRLDGAEDAGKTVWGRVLMDKARDTAQFWEGRIGAVLSEAAANPDFEKAYGESLRVTLSGIERFKTALEAGTWDEAREASAVSFPRPKNISGFDDLKEVRTQCRKALEKTAELFYDSSEKCLGDMRLTAPAVSSLLKTVLLFENKYSAEKRRRGILDFSDQEHLALKLLVDGETGEPTRTAREISLRFAEIMVDEYQDVNEIQELIFGAVSREGRNIFMVGDVKQSIYRFRLADPTIFLRKYLSFKDAQDAEDGEGRRIILSRNFRSRAEILNAANFVFKNVMSVKFGDMDYTPREYLYPGASYPESSEPPVELYVIDAGSEIEEESQDDKTDVEARFAAGRIRELVGSAMVSDGVGGLRPADFGDIAILMRSPRSRLPKWIAALSEQGIPVAAETSSGFFGEMEVSIALSLMYIIDNPRQDIPLISVLRSPVYGFTSEELARIRLEDQEGDFYSALKKSAGKEEKSALFLKELEDFRRAAPDMTSDELLWHVCGKTGLFAIVSAMPGGEKRRANLMRLFEYARSFESAGYKGLFGFVTYMRRLQEQGETPQPDAGAGAENAVTIMSIHKSKGLEFPIVILADTTRRFNTEDSKKPLLIHPELGVGPKRVDIARRIEYPTIARRAVRAGMLSEGLSEELRVLYVAMTRAKEKLIMLCSFTDAERELA
ncbi:MAG: helicase-exonuclease AddAB subunit AddA, partial [Oscillospiraceae bacterium]